MIDRADNFLLREFVEERSEAAFAELVRRHIDLVYSVARRSLSGDAHLAEDVTQSVFAELAKNARKLLSHPSVAGWLYSTTRFISSRVRRAADRRIGREVEFNMLNKTESAEATVWADVEKVLDDALQELPECDREAVLLRYFQNQPFSAVAAVVGATENAARMRVERALDKLRAALERRGVKCTSAVLGGLIIAHGVSSAPAALAATVGAAALVTGVTSFAVPQIALISMNTTKIAIATVALVGTTTGWLMSERKADKLDGEIARLRAEAPKAAADGWSAAEEAQVREELTKLRAQHSELMRLRADVTQLRNQLRERPASTSSAPVAKNTDARDRNEQWKDQMKDMALAKMGAANAWGIAFFHFAEANDGRLPATLSDAAGFFPPQSVQGNSVNEFEIVFQGSISDIENPGEAIIMRDKEPFYRAPDGSAQRTYLFADGHTEVHSARDGVFEAWEEQRRPRLRNVGEFAPGAGGQ